MAIDYLIPDMPSAGELLPFLREMDQNRYYSNFGPLHEQFKTSLRRAFFPKLLEQQFTLVSSGTAAIELALRSLKLEAGSEVLVPVFTFPATAQAVINCGLKPVFADIDPDTFLLTAGIAVALHERLNFAAVLPVAVAGMPVDAKAWAQFSHDLHVPVVVDAAPALGNQTVESGLIYAFSMHATKLFGIGEGGIVVDTRSAADSLNPRTNFGFDHGKVVVQGGNYKLSEYHCAVGLAQLNRLGRIRESRQRVYANYIEQLNVFCKDKVVLQKNSHENSPSSLMVSHIDLSAKRLYEGLLKQGIISRRLFWPLLCDHDFNFSDQKSLAFSVASRVSEQWLALPFHHFLSQQDIVNVCKAVSGLATEMASEAFKTSDNKNSAGVF